MSIKQSLVSKMEIFQVLKTVEDPEMPISIVDLGIVEKVHVNENGAVAVTLRPTFSGCPALEIIEKNVKNTLREELGLADIEVKWALDGKWSSEMITPEGKMALREFGIALAQKQENVACPYCLSYNVVRESAFGCSLCREIFYCRDCKNPFEKIKQV